jgi:outer membrane protein OmpA-like peptidoglycan-associated protein
MVGASKSPTFHILNVMPHHKINLNKLKSMIKKLIVLFLVIPYIGIESFSQTVKVPHATYIFDCSFLPDKSVVSGYDQKHSQSRPINPRHFIIQSKAELTELTKCEQNYNFDFDKNILIGVYGQTSGCGPGFCFFEVFQDTIQKKIVVNYMKTATGLCRGMFPYQSFIQIEKPDEKYHIELIKVDSLVGFEKRPQSYFSLMGRVSQYLTKEYLSTKISIQELDPPYNVYFASSNVNYEGRYLINLPRNKEYTISVFLDSLYFHENLEIDTIPKEPYYKKREIGVLEKNIELRPINKHDKIVLKNIYFESGKHELREESYLELSALYMFLLSNPKLKVEISGHTDNIGSSTLNLELSKKRAQAVADYLIKKGISIDRILVVGYGDTQPIMDNDSGDSREKNRRIEFKIVEK